MIKNFDEVFEDVTKLGVKIKTDEYHPIGKYQIIDQGQEAVAGYSDLEDGVFENVPAIVFGGHTRIVKYVGQPFFLGADGVKVLRSRFKDANYRYLYYALKSVKIPNTGYNRHFKWLKEAKIYYPNSEEQSKIVLILDGISSVIEHRQRQLQKLDELVKARFVEMFGNPVDNSKHFDLVPLGQLGVLKRGVSKHRPRNDAVLLGGNYPLIQTGDVSNAKDYITEYTSTYSEEGLIQSKMWGKGTLCITIAANIADTAILNFDACFPDSVVGFIPNEKVTTLFIHNWFKFLQPVLEENAPAVAQKNQNVATLEKTGVIVPPIEMQNEFEIFVQQVDKSKFVVQQALDKAQLLFDSLMQQYFG